MNKTWLFGPFFDPIHLKLQPKRVMTVSCDWGMFFLLKIKKENGEEFRVLRPLVAVADLMTWSTLEAWPSLRRDKKVTLRFYSPISANSFKFNSNKVSELIFKSTDLYTYPPHQVRVSVTFSL